MAFENRIVEFPNRVTLTDENGTVKGTYTITRNEGTVTQEGTPLTAENLNEEIAEVVNSAMSGISIDGSHNVHFRNLQRGVASLKMTAKNQTVKTHVTFPQAFTLVPTVVCTPLSAAPGNVHISVKNVTTTGCDIYMFRSTKQNTSVNWIAIA